MVPTRWSEVKVAAQEFKKDLERDFIIRRYHIWLEGQTPWEERVLETVARAQAQAIASWRAAAKRSLDIVGAATGIILFSPVMLTVAIGVALDSKGPVIYRQTRVGYRGRLFEIMKFRTMTQDAEAQSGPAWAKANDPRVTRLGTFLRKSHLDELPQFFNVLKGEMSLVGPRPERPYFVEELRKQIPNYDHRLNSKPGITGLAQIRQHYDETLDDVKRKVRYDRFYIRKMCPLLDVKVILLTAGDVLLRKGR
jgi:exopolysaccharide biosynthesis polyprenyl glycosylphosphotransferase